MSVYYNENDPKAAAWLRALIASGHLPAGDVDERSIIDVRPADLLGYAQHHFFAGIGGWPLALRLAGWPDDRPVWTGSCPCQPLSGAGKRKGHADERHLWPAFHGLIAECDPPVVFGEQVASKDGREWLAAVRADLEALGYACGAADLCAAGVGAPHIRQRLYWVADAAHLRGWIGDTETGEGAGAGRSGSSRMHGDDGGLADAAREFVDGDGTTGTRRRHEHPDGGVAGRLGVANGGGSSPWREAAASARHGSSAIATGGRDRPGADHVDWRDADWLWCRDGKWRPVEASPQSMADGLPYALGRVRDQIAQEFKEEIDALALESQVDRAALLRELREGLRAQAGSVWPVGGIPGLHEAPFLLAFLRELTSQGWTVEEGVPLSCEEDARNRVRSMRDGGSVAGAPCERRLAGQSTGQHPNAVHLLSSLLARHAHSAWGDAHSAYAEIGFPLGKGSQARVARLRGYGNAIVPQVAAVFIEAWREIG